jgi:hypothetical protein
MSITYNGSAVTTAAIPNANNGTFFAYYGVTAMYVTTAGSSGTQTASAAVSGGISGNVTVYMQEMKK